MPVSQFTVLTERWHFQWVEKVDSVVMDLFSQTVWYWANFLTLSGTQQIFDTLLSCPGQLNRQNHIGFLFKMQVSGWKYLTVSLYENFSIVIEYHYQYITKHVTHPYIFYSLPSGPLLYPHAATSMQYLLVWRKFLKTPFFMKPLICFHFIIVNLQFYNSIHLIYG